MPNKIYGQLSDWRRPTAIFLFPPKKLWALLTELKINIVTHGNILRTTLTKKLSFGLFPWIP